MNRRPTQFGVHENTASPGQHASRLVLNTTSPSTALLGHDVDAENAVPTAGPESTILVSDSEIVAGGAGEQPALRKRGTKRKYDELSNTLSTPGVTVGNLLSIHDAAQFLAVSVSTLYGWVWQRKISFVKVGRAVRFDLSDLKKFVDENRIHARVPRKL
jgi:excisionase family DNA binding protein